MAKKKSKAKARSRKAAKDLAPRDARAVKGGGDVVARKAGKGQQEFLIVKMTDVLITGVTATGNTDGGLAGPA
jgi:hypothetical protein